MGLALMPGVWWKLKLPRIQQITSISDILMLERAKFFGVISVLAVSLAACSGDSQSASTTAPDNTSPAVTTSSSSVDAGKASSTPTGSNPQEKINSSEVKFKPAPANVIYGVFDIVNGSSAPAHKVAKSKPTAIAGWATLPNKSKPADLVVITLADNKTIVAVASVNAVRDDVVKVMKNPAFKNSGWNATIAPSTLPTGKVVLKAWAYDSVTKEATQLGRIHDLEVAQ